MSDKPQPQLESDRFGATEQKNNFWTITVPGGEHKPSKDELLHPSFLAHVAGKLSPYDEIRVRCDDGSFYARLLVTRTDWASAGCEVLEWKELNAVNDARTTTIGFDVKWNGPHDKWVVIRNSDKAVVHKGAGSQRDAQFWLDNQKLAA